MAVSTGSTLLSSDMQSWYNRLNAVISKYGGGMAGVTVPAANKRADASDVNTIVNKFNSIKSDAYLGNDSWIYTAGYTSVSVGELIRASQGTAIITTLTRLEAIKCRNNARYSNGDSNARNSYGDSNARNSYGDSNARNSYGDSNARKSNGDSKSTKSNGDSNARNSNGNSNSRQSNGFTQSARTYDRQSVSGRYNTNQCYFWGQSGKSNGNANATNSDGNSNSRNSYGDSNARNSYGDSNARNSYGNSNARNSYGDSQSRNSRDSRIDIYNSRTVV